MVQRYIKINISFHCYYYLQSSRTDFAFISIEYSESGRLSLDSMQSISQGGSDFIVKILSLDSDFTFILNLSVLSTSELILDGEKGPQESVLIPKKMID